jgi:predicted anti-sigma-YlaC factor YlaD
MAYATATGCRRQAAGLVRPVRTRFAELSLLALFSLFVAACSPKVMVVDMLGSAMAEGGDSYASDGDPEFVREALPFGLKTMEGLLEISPDNRDLLLAASRGHTGYGFLLLADEENVDILPLRQRRILRDRAKQHYLRGRDYALAGLETSHPGITERLTSGDVGMLAETTAEDAAFLYWAGAAWASAAGTDPGDMQLVVDLATAAALVRRVLEVDEEFEDGAAHEFFISYEGNRPGGSYVDARLHYERAVELSKGLRASVHLALAEAVAVPTQDLDLFRELVGRALAVNPDAVPQLRLANAIAHRRAAWLSDQVPDLFFDAGVPTS